MLKLPTTHPLYQTLLAADLAWSTELQAVFGKQAGNARYDRKKNNSTPALASLHKAVGVAQEAWDDANTEFEVRAWPAQADRGTLPLHAAEALSRAKAFEVAAKWLANDPAVHHVALTSLFDGHITIVEREAEKKFLDNGER